MYDSFSSGEVFYGRMLLALVATVILATVAHVL